MSKRNKGFTLIELLVAVALSSVLLAALYGVFFTVVSAGSAARKGLEGRVEAGRLLDRMSRDIHGAYFRPQASGTLFAAESKAMASALTLTAFNKPVVRKGYPTSDISAVRYFTEERADGLHVIREVWNPFIGEKNSAEAIGGIKGFEISCFNGTDWSKAWDGMLEGRLPAAVRVSLMLGDGTELSMLARTMTVKD